MNTSSTQHAQPSPTIDIPALIDARPIGRFQFGIFLLAGAAMIIDGFDVQSMGFVAPELVRDWGIERGALGSVFSASLVGMLLGSLALSVLADRIGRRPVLVVSMLFAGACMLGTAHTHGVAQLLAMRTLSGVGVGAIMGNAMALVSEYSPARRRASTMMLVSCGFTAGAVFGGLVSGWLIPLAGWRAVFLAGGAVSLAIGVLMAAWLPESVQFLVLRGRRPEQAARLVARIAGGAAAVPGLAGGRLVAGMQAAKPSGAPVAELFRGGRAGITLLLWGLNFANLLNLFFLSNWLPTIIADLGHTRSVAIAVGTLLQVGGTLGTIGMGLLIDRAGYARVLVPAFVVAAAAIVAIGQPGLPLAPLLAVVTVSGLCIVGGQPAINALTASVYPTHMRATGIGWGLGIGRAGSILGPVAAGQLAMLGGSDRIMFAASAVIALASCVMTLALARRRRALRPDDAMEAPPAGARENTGAASCRS
ncbi:MFS transporter [Burkholderia sp. Ac-20379]|uniref:MFS transporter n=1 Tax=Burkholderia sp. Ac-20379 TaxID=2703900 RepID=UPI00197F5EFC|nr:MFS transporter [Burkholderia sp. Ac-20379]MBN3724217.1 MFS transporter [Burkholderia sp. Ac-20379]